MFFKKIQCGYAVYHIPRGLASRIIYRRIRRKCTNHFFWEINLKVLNLVSNAFSYWNAIGKSLASFSTTNKELMFCEAKT